MLRLPMTLFTSSVVATANGSRRIAPALCLTILAAALMLAVQAPAIAQSGDEAPATATADQASEPTEPAETQEAAAAGDSPTSAEPEPAPTGEAAPADESPSAADAVGGDDATAGDATAEGATAEDAGAGEESPSAEQSAADEAQPSVVQIGETEVEPAGTGSYNLLPLALFAVVIVGAFALASLIASGLRVKEYQGKLTIIFLSIFSAAAIAVSGWPPKLGIDLKGGVYLVYQLGDEASESLATLAGAEEEEETSEGLTQDEMDKLVTAISRRINPSGVKEVTIRPFGKGQIEIIIPEVDESEIERYKEKITSAGTLEFRILASTRDTRDNTLIEEAGKSEEQYVFMRDAEGNRLRDPDGDFRLLGWWVPISEGADAERSFSRGDIVKRTRKVGDRTMTEVLVVKDPYDVTGKYLVRSAPGVDQTGRPNVTFMFNSSGGALFGGLTGDNLPDEVHDLTRQLGIILDGYLFSAPSIQSQIRERGEITGDFTKQQVRDLVDVLNAGSLPTTLEKEPISQLSTGPTLGRDTIRSGSFAIAVSMVIVLVFMLVYYRFAGLVACLAMLTNLLLILGVMILVKAAFTLPGLAGLVLTVGMAVDANVLIFERIREELDRQATLRMAIRNGFSRATTTIVDANLTTLITGIVLYTIGTDQVRGFAVTLILGVTLSMYTAIYCARVIFDIAEKKRWLTRMSMARLPLQGNVDFIGRRRMAAAFSVVVILIGLVAVVVRGKGLMDIDFTGGVSVQALFREEQSTSGIREALLARQDVFDDLIVNEASRPDEPPRRRFVINSARPDDEEIDADVYLRTVKATLEEVFGDKLVHHSMKITRQSGPSPGTAPAGSTVPDETETGMRRADLPPNDLLALADDPGLLVAQAPAEATPGEATEEGSEAAPDAKQGAAAEEASEEAPSAEAAVPSEPEAPAALPPAQPPQTAAPEVEPTTWKVAFGDDKISYATLEKQIQTQMEALDTTAYFELTNPGYAEDYDRDRGHPAWTVTIYLPTEQGERVLEEVQKSVESMPVFPSSNTIGGKVAEDTQWKAVAALLASLVFIVAYIWVRFQRVMFGLAAVVALVHDVTVTLGVIALTSWLAPVLGFLLVDEFKIGLSVLAAFLTIIGYSLNDTIVVFDRIREVRGKAPSLTAEMINKSINQTLARTLLTSFTTLVVVVILYAFGGLAIRAFAFSLVIGVIVGTYSSIFVASPVLLWIAQTSAAKSQKS